MFYNEYDILEGRLEYLNDIVDYFVIVENDTTHAGFTKPFNFTNHISRYRKYTSKILYFPISTNRSQIPYTAPYPRDLSMNLDAGQRSQIIRGLKLFDDNDVILISDLDEIPNKNLVLKYSDMITEQIPAYAFQQDMMFYNLNQKQVRPWSGTVITKNKFVKQHGVQWFRDNRTNFTPIENGGWHLSYWGDLSKISNKIKTFAHQEFNEKKFTDESLIHQRILSGLDPFERSYNQLTAVDISQLDKDFLKTFKKYNKKIIPHYWQTIDGWWTEENCEFYQEMLDRFVGSAHFVEIGSFKGRSSSYMAVAIANSGKNIKFDCVDPFTGNPEHQPGQVFENQDVIDNKIYNIFLKNMEPVKDYYSLKKMTSVEAARTYPDQSLDFVFIDGLHDYDNVTIDIHSWFPKIKKGGILAGHDYAWTSPLLMKAVNESVKKVRSYGNCWYIEK